MGKKTGAHSNTLARMKGTEVLGKGSYGVVYKVKRDGVIYARKTSFAETYHDLALDICKEISILRELRGSAHVVQINPENAVFWEQASPRGMLKYCAFDLEFAQGSLEERAESRNMFECFHELALGLKACHDADILHRDLKPSNALFVGGRVKIADFGPRNVYLVCPGAPTPRESSRLGGDTPNFSAQWLCGGCTRSTGTK